MRTTRGLAICHEASPDQTGLVVERQDAPRKKSLRPLRPREPGIERIALPAARLFENPATNFRDRQRGDEQILVTLCRHPGQQRIRWLRLDDIADDVGIEKIMSHRLTLRPFSRGRERSRSAPTRGERRKAVRILPGLGGLPATAVLTAMRTFSACGPSSAKRRASVRINSRSDSRAMISKRVRPRWDRRAR